MTRLPRCEWRIREAPFKLLLVGCERDQGGAIRWRLMTQKQFVHEWAQGD